MAKRTSTSSDTARVLSAGDLTATGKGTAVVAPATTINVTVSGTFTATWRPVRSFDGGTTYHPVTDVYGVIYSFTSPASFVIEEPERNVWYAVECTAYTSGTITYRLSR